MPRIAVLLLSTLFMTTGWFPVVALHAQGTVHRSPPDSSHAAVLPPGSTSVDRTSVDRTSPDTRVNDRARRLGHRLPIRLVQNDPVGGASSKSDRWGGPIPIDPPTESRTSKSAPTSDSQSRSSRTTGRNVAWVVISSLAIVLGLFFLVVWVSRRALPKASANLPKEVLELLGRSPLGSRHHLQLVRLGHRLLLISVTQDGAETLSEITDQDEVNDVVASCRRQAADSVSGTFRNVLFQLGAGRTSSRRRPTSSGRTESLFRSSSLAAEPTGEGPRG